MVFTASTRPAAPAPLLLLTAALLSISTAAAAEEDSIATDRPDFVESSNVVGKGRLQIETSLAWDRNRAAGVTERLSATPTLFRYGISENWEIRLETDGRLMQRTSEGALRTRERGVGDVSLGMKWHVADAVDRSPSIGVLFHADLASGSRAFRGDGVRPSARLVAEWELDAGMSLGVMPGLAYQRGDDGGVSGIFGIVVGKSLTDKLRSFVELSMPQIARSSKGGTEAALTVGGAYLITNTLQVDAASSRGLNQRTPDYSFTVGLSVKL